jgi:hypothetical protein
MIDPRKRLERILALCGLLLGYYFAYFFQNALHFPIRLVDMDSLVKMGLVTAIIIPLIHYVFVKRDPLQRSPSKTGAIAFFQREFPSKYLLLRCEQCVEDESSCSSFLKPDEATHGRLWFREIFHGVLEKSYPGVGRETFKKGYACKLLYGLTGLFTFFGTLAALLLIGHNIWRYSFLGASTIDVSAEQVFFLSVCVVVAVYIRLAHRANIEAPSGCWHAWREINRQHISWMRDNEPILNQLVCQRSGSTKTYRPK